MFSFLTSSCFSNLISTAQTLAPTDVWFFWVCECHKRFARPPLISQWFGSRRLRVMDWTNHICAYHSVCCHRWGCSPESGQEEPEKHEESHQSLISHHKSILPQHWAADWDESKGFFFRLQTLERRRLPEKAVKLSIAAIVCLWS